MKLSSVCMEAYTKPPFVLIAAIAILIWASDTLAYVDYSDGCDNCHGSFTENPYTSLSDGSTWSSSLHNVHRNDMLDGDCDVCHTGSTSNPVLLESSDGGSGLAAISCVGCHGRDEDDGNVTSTGFSQRGAGLRQYHAGEANCGGCHDDQTGYTPVGEDILPNYYANPGTGHPAMPTDSCNPSGSENFAGTALGLDNDGDGVYDTADSDCGVVAETATLTLAKTVVNNDGGSAVDTDFTLTATGPDTISGVEGSGAVTSAVVAIGDYALTESALAGYTLQGWVCTSGLSGATVTLAADDVVTCTATNDDDLVVVDTATLTLAKTVVNNDGGSAVDTDFTLTATGPDTISGVEGDAAITSATVAVGAYALTESALAGYTLQGWVCTSGLSGATVTLAADDVVTCTVTNTDDPVVTDTATLTLAKTVVNNDGGSAVDTDFTLTATGPDTISGVEGDAAITSATVTVGAYALTESALAGYTLQDWVCTSGLSGSTVTLAKDQVVTCTATNTDDPFVATPALTLSKTASPSTFNAVGELISYSYVVSSTGNVPVVGPITVTDTLMSVTCPPVSSVGNSDGNLDPGETLVCTSSYVVQQADFDAGFITSSSTASGENASTGLIPITVTNSLLNPIPTLNEWTVILLSFLFLLMGLGYLRRKAMI